MNTSFDTKECALKVGILGVNTDTEAEAIRVLEKYAESVVEVQVLSIENSEKEGTTVFLRACFEDRNAYVEALKVLQSQPEIF